ncbi:MAG: hypothetical protein LBK60_09020 [Verrucomicrobiales bacterium]|nr:hypothetical protein [Verrucomicrobiales bacterium]
MCLVKLAASLERDVRNTLNIGSLRDFDRLLRAAALRAGQLFWQKKSLCTCFFVKKKLTKT